MYEIYLTDGCTVYAKNGFLSFLDGSIVEVRHIGDGLKEGEGLSSDDVSTEEASTEEISTEEASTEEISTEEASTEEASTESNDIIYLDENADVHPYLSSEVQGATLNNLYTVVLSTRNILLLFFLFFVALKLFSWFKSVLYRIMNK